MHTTRRFGVLVALVSLVAGVGSVAGGLSAAPPGLPPDLDVTQVTKSSSYIVVLEDAPAVAYRGGVQGLAATAPAKGKKFDSTSAAAKKYAAYLTGKHDNLLKRVGAADKKFYSYTWALNGFAATLTSAQAAQLSAAPGVLFVQADQLRQITTDNSTEFLGLNDDPNGLWSQLGGQGRAGEDVVVGVLDTGIWPEHPSFSDQADLVFRTGQSGKRSQVYGAPPATWHGTCQSGEQFSQDMCTNKLIGARYFLSGYGHFGVIKNDFKSARDADGHGTHTASTAAGNANVPAAILGTNLGVVSGMAPRARVAAYKVCWNGDAGGCPTSDTSAAIDAAVADGVDVLNLSLGSSAPSMLGADDVALLFAADAGVFAAQSAGNDGPDASTIGTSSAPWITSVAAGTQDRTFSATVTLGNGAVYSGASVTGAVGPAPLVDAAAVSFDGSDLCVGGTLDPAKVAGKIVLCKRGSNARVEKSQSVKAAGGVGMVLYNAVSPQATVTDNHYVPSVHLVNSDGLAVKAYIASSGSAATARLSAAAATGDQGSVVADFSSRGPNLAAGDILKPDIIAPGVNILAGASPAQFLGAPGQLFQSISGTSMSSPHVAGLAALLVDLHPGWSAAAIKSALMTSARTDVVKEDGSTPASPFDMGSGYVRPNSAANPGLVYDSDFGDYLRFLCGNGDVTGVLCTTFGSIDPSDLNQPNITVGALAGLQTVRRTVTNVGEPGTYTPTVVAPAGVSVTVTPPSLNLLTGATATYSVQFTTLAGATFDQYSFGSLTWTSGATSVRSTLTVRPVAVAAPEEAPLGAGVSGSVDYSITFGTAGPFKAVGRGPVAADVQAGNVVDDPANDIETALESGVGITVHTISVPAGTEYVRISLFDEEVDGATDDLDLYVFGPSFDQVGGSGSATSTEEVNLVRPTAGTYYIVVHGWQTDGPDANYNLFTWQLPGTAPTNLVVTAPTTATLGANANVNVAWAGLTPGTRYLGLVTYHDVAAPADIADHNIGSTVVRING